MWEIESGIGGAFLLKKSIKDGKGNNEGNWDGIHLISMKKKENQKFEYKLTSTVLLSFSLKNSPKTGNTEISGSLSCSVTDYLLIQAEGPNRGMQKGDRRVPHWEDGETCGGKRNSAEEGSGERVHQ